MPMTGLKPLFFRYSLALTRSKQGWDDLSKPDRAKSLSSNAFSLYCPYRQLRYIYPNFIIPSAPCF